MEYLPLLARDYNDPAAILEVSNMLRDMAAVLSDRFVRMRRGDALSPVCDRDEEDEDENDKKVEMLDTA